MEALFFVFVWWLLQHFIFRRKTLQMVELDGFIESIPKARDIARQRSARNTSSTFLVVVPKGLPPEKREAPYMVVRQDRGNVVHLDPNYIVLTRFRGGRIWHVNQHAGAS